MNYTSIIVNTGNADVNSLVGFNIPSTIGYIEKDKIYTLQFKIRVLSNSYILDNIYIDKQKLNNIDVRDFDIVKLDDADFRLCYITFTSDSKVLNPSIKICKSMVDTDIKNTDIFEITDISLNFGRLSKYDVNVGDFMLLRKEVNTKIQQLSDMILLNSNSQTIDELTGKINKALGQIQVEAGKISLKAEKEEVDRTINAQVEILNDKINSKVSQTDYDSNNDAINEKFSKITQATDKITLEVSKKVNSSEVKSIIEQNPSSIKIAFNNISSEWEFTDNRLTNKQSGNKSLSLYHGRLNTYSFQNGSFTGFLGSTTSWDSESSKWRDGVTVSTTGNAHYINFGHRPMCYSDSNVNEGDFSPILTLVTAPHNNLERGIYTGGNLYIPHGRYLDCDEHVTANGFKGKTNTTLFYNAGTGSAGGGLQLSIDGITYFNPEWDNCVSLGSGSHRYRYIYLVNAPYVSSDSRLKEDISYIDEDENPIFTSDEVYNFFKNIYKPTTYKFKERSDNETKVGFIAQDLLYDKVGSYLVSMNETMPNSTNPNDLPNLSYNQGNLEGLIAIALKEEIRKRDKQIESLEKENKNLKSRLDNIEKILGIVK